MIPENHDPTLQAIDDAIAVYDEIASIFAFLASLDPETGEPTEFRLASIGDQT